MGYLNEFDLEGLPDTYPRILSGKLQQMVDHAFEKPCSFLVFWRSVDGTVYYYAVYGTGSNQAGKILSAATSTDALVTFQALESVASENSKINVKHGDYIFSATWSPTKKLRIHGEGEGTRLLNNGTYDAIDITYNAEVRTWVTKKKSKFGKTIKLG